MKTKHELNLLPLVRKSKGKNTKDKVRVLIRVTLNCQPIEISLNLLISKKNWRVKSKQVSKGEPNSKEINKKILQASTTLDEIYDKLFHTHELVTPLLIKQTFEGTLPSDELVEESMDLKPEFCPERRVIPKIVALNLCRLKAQRLQIINKVNFLCLGTGYFLFIFHTSHFKFTIKSITKLKSHKSYPIA